MYWLAISQVLKEKFGCSNTDGMLSICDVICFGGGGGGGGRRIGLAPKKTRRKRFNMDLVSSPDPPSTLQEEREVW